MDKTIQAKHLADKDLLRIVFGLSTGELPDELTRLGIGGPRGPEAWTFTSDIAEYMPADIPWKVINAKLAALIRRGLLEGCTCGCRGDFYLTPAGRALITGKDMTPSPA